MIIHTMAFMHLSSFDDNTKKLENCIIEFSVLGETNLFFLGELIFTEYNLDEQYIQLNKYSLDSPKMLKIIDLAKKYDVCISFGYIESFNDSTYNSQVFISNVGQILHNHRKCNLTKKESLVFEKGDKAVSSFMFEGYKFSVSICYDMFSDSFKNNYEKDTDILFHSLTDPQDGRFTLGFTGRYTSSYFVASNRYDSLNKYNGHIGVYSSLGSRLDFSMNKEEVLHFNFNPKKIKRSKLLLYLKIFFHLLRFPIRTIKYVSWSMKN
jgi:predicted amidohydrolase